MKEYPRLYMLQRELKMWNLIIQMTEVKLLHFNGNKKRKEILFSII